MLHLVAHGLGAAPLQKDLLDAAGAGHPKTLRALQLGFGVHRQGPTVDEGAPMVINPASATNSTPPPPRTQHPFGDSPVSSVGVQPLEHGPAGLSADVARQSLRPHQLAPPVARLHEGPVAAAGAVPAAQGRTKVNRSRRSEAGRGRRGLTGPAAAPST